MSDGTPNHEHPKLTFNSTNQARTDFIQNTHRKQQFTKFNALPKTILKTISQEKNEEVITVQ